MSPNNPPEIDEKWKKPYYGGWIVKVVATLLILGNGDFWNRGRVKTETVFWIITIWKKSWSSWYKKSDLEILKF